VVVSNANKKISLSRKGFLRDLAITNQDQRKPFSNAGIALHKLQKQHVLSAKSLATGLHSVLCGRNQGSNTR
jgi:hypothetical protein